MQYFGGRMKAVFDMGNFVLDGYNPIDAYELLKDYVEYFHIKDSLYAGAIVPAGKGEAQIKEILTRYDNSDKKPTFITLEPHLQTFSGLNALVGKSFDNPYKYDNQKSAFEDAVKCLKSLI
jgi:sugar phosphate isomerase/epimerase